MMRSDRELFEEAVRTRAVIYGVRTGSAEDATEILHAALCLSDQEFDAARETFRNWEPRPERPWAMATDFWRGMIGADPQTDDGYSLHNWADDNREVLRAARAREAEGLPCDAKWRQEWMASNRPGSDH